MAFLDTLKRIFGMDAGTPMPPAPPVRPAEPVAVITLRKGQASISTPGRADVIADAPYRRPTVVPNGTYTAQRQGSGIALSQGGTRVTTVYPNDQAGSNDLGLQFLMWQMLLNQVDNDSAATVRIDDQHVDDRPDADTDPVSGPDTDLGDLDPASPTQAEQDAAKALGVLGYESTQVPPPAKEDPVPAATAPVEPPAPATPAPEPIPAPVPSDSWSPSGAYER